MRPLRIAVDQNKCVGSTMCVHTAQGVFALDDSNKSSVINPRGNTEEKILEAAESCPVSAIIVEDAETGESVFP